MKQTTSAITKNLKTGEMTEGKEKKYEFLCNAFLQDLVKNFESNIYNSEPFLNLQPVKDRLSYYIIRKGTNVAEGQIHFLIADNTAFSLLKSPFGSFELNQALPFKILFDFWEHIESDLSNRGIEKVVIKSSPDFYSPTVFSQITILLLNYGFNILTSEINHYLEVTGESLYPHLKKMKRTRLNRCLKGGFTFHEELAEEAGAVFEFILRCRKEKGYAFSMTVDELLRTMKALPEIVKVFTIKDKENVIAATVTVIVNQRVMYNFALANITGYETYSPAVMLLDKLYRYCFHNKMEILDLGTSAINSRPNFSLAEFKESIGGKAGIKLTFNKVIKK